MEFVHTRGERRASAMVLPLVHHDFLDESTKVLVLLPLLYVGQVVVVRLPLQLQIALIPISIELAGINCAPNCAIRLPGMGTIGEATAAGALMAIGTVVINPLVRPKKSKLAHTGGVHQHCPIVEKEQLAA
jgi:hypothetical protein